MTLLSLSKEKIIKSDFFKLIGADPIFSACTKREMERILKGVKCLSFVEGQALFCKGDWPQNVYLIESGGIKIIREVGASKEVIIRFVGKKTLVGMECLFREHKYNKSAVCVVPANVFVIPNESIRNLINLNITCYNGVIDQLTKDLIYTRTRIVSLSQKTASQRLAESLLLLYNFFGIDGQKQVKTQVKPVDLVSIAGSTLGNLYKLLVLFESMGLIKYKNNLLVLLDLRKLSRIAEAELPI